MIPISDQLSKNIDIARKVQTGAKKWYTGAINEDGHLCMHMAVGPVGDAPSEYFDMTKPDFEQTIKQRFNSKK